MVGHEKARENGEHTNTLTYTPVLEPLLTRGITTPVSTQHNITQILNAHRKHRTFKQTTMH